MENKKKSKEEQGIDAFLTEMTKPITPLTDETRDSFFEGVSKFQTEQRGTNMTNGLNKQAEQVQQSLSIETQPLLFFKESDEKLKSGADEGALDLTEAVSHIAQHPKYTHLFNKKNRELVQTVLSDIHRSGYNLVLNNLHAMKQYDETLVKKGVIDALPEGLFYHSVATAATSIILYKHLLKSSEFKEALESISGRDVFLGGLLHDQGKRIMPGSQLHQRGTIPDQEWKEFTWHPVDGESLLTVFDRHNEYLGHAERLTPVVTDISLMHHLWPSYKVQGGKEKSYPLELYTGKDGEYLTADIPAHVRIVTAADGFDAMSRKRVYRKDMTVEDVVDEIVRESKVSESNQAGVHYDPVIAYKLSDLVLGIK